MERRKAVIVILLSFSKAFEVAYLLWHSYFGATRTLTRLTDDLVSGKLFGLLGSKGVKQ